MKSMVAVVLMLTVHERMRMVIVVPVAPLPQEGHMYHKIDRTSSIDCKEVQVRIVVYNSYNVTGIQRKDGAEEEMPTPVKTRLFRQAVATMLRSRLPLFLLLVC